MESSEGWFETCDANTNAKANANGNASEFTCPTQTQGKRDTQAQ